MSDLTQEAVDSLILEMGHEVDKSRHKRFQYDEHGNPTKYPVSKTKCPCCGGNIRVNRPLVDLNTNTLTYGKWVVTLRPIHAEIASILVDAWPLTARTDRIVRGAWGDSDTRESDKLAHLRVAISQLRSKLKETGMGVEVLYGSGYRITF